MKKKLTTVLLMLFILGLIMIEGTWAQTLMAGVAVGNTFTYDVASFWSSSDPNATIPIDLVDVNQTEYLQVVINGVSGSLVSTLYTYHFKNGTETSSGGGMNLETGESNGGFWAITAADLSVNERIHPLGQDTITVNETMIRNYLGVERETNRLITEYRENDTDVRMDRYFDKKTGMLVELRDETSYVNPTRTITVFWKIKETNVWSSPQAFPVVLILPILIAAALIGVLFYTRRKQKKH